MEEGETTLVVQFDMDGHQFGLAASDVLEILRAATPSPLPGAPAVVTGILNVRGQLVPVYDIRARFRLNPRPMRSTDHLVVLDAGRTVAIVVEQVHALVAVPKADISAARDLPASSEGVEGVARLPDGMVVIFDLRSFLAEAEAAELDAALERGVPPRETAA
ncbi:MAG: chemotaxis protein CheW [Pseudomonadota bacterium]|nr:chemotaxis protein CheW [Pseudomonadota bacterium]